jgi:hypothetical protein
MGFPLSFIVNNHILISNALFYQELSIILAEIKAKHQHAILFAQVMLIAPLVSQLF